MELQYKLANIYIKYGYTTTITALAMNMNDRIYLLIWVFIIFCQLMYKEGYNWMILNQ